MGAQVNLSTAFHPQMDGQEKWTIKALQYILRSCVIDFKGCWYEYFPLVEFSYYNNFHSSISMAPNEALNDRRLGLLLDGMRLENLRFLVPI